MNCGVKWEISDNMYNPCVVETGGTLMAKLDELIDTFKGEEY